MTSLFQLFSRFAVGAAGGESGATSGVTVGKRESSRLCVLGCAASRKHRVEERKLKRVDDYWEAVTSPSPRNRGRQTLEKSVCKRVLL